MLKIDLADADEDLVIDLPLLLAEDLVEAGDDIVLVLSIGDLIADPADAGDRASDADVTIDLMLLTENLAADSAGDSLLLYIGDLPEELVDEGDSTSSAIDLTVAGLLIVDADADAGDDSASTGDLTGLLMADSTDAAGVSPFAFASSSTGDLIGLFIMRRVVNLLDLGLNEFVALRARRNAL